MVPTPGNPAAYGYMLHWPVMSVVLGGVLPATTTSPFGVAADSGLAAGVTTAGLEKLGSGSLTCVCIGRFGSYEFACSSYAFIILLYSRIRAAAASRSASIAAFCTADAVKAADMPADSDISSAAASASFRAFACCASTRRTSSGLLRSLKGIETKEVHRRFLGGPSEVPGRSFGEREGGP